MIDENKVSYIFRDCLFNDGEDTSAAVLVDGVTVDVGFHPGRLEQHTVEIITYLNQLPKSIKTGMSFLALCDDNKGSLWTGNQQVVEELLSLGIGVGKVKNMFPRSLWSLLPGNAPVFIMPDYMID